MSKPVKLLLVNYLTGQKAKTAARREELKLETRLQIPTLKLAYGKMDLTSEDTLSILNTRAIQYLTEVLKCYGNSYNFKEGNIYYDCKANPKMHAKAYYMIRYQDCVNK